MEMEALKYLSISSLAFANYFNTLYGSFVFDDAEAIVKNKDVNPNTPIINTFKNDFWGTDITLNKSHKSYRPITVLTYRLNYMFAESQLNAFQFHCTNVIFYVVLCMLTLPYFRVFLKKNDGVHFFASLLFTVHPVHTEAVAALVGRADLLSGILFIVSLLLYERVISKRSNMLFLLTVILVWIAVLCKETAITALAVCMVYDVLRSNILRKLQFKQQKGRILRVTCLCLCAMFMLYFRWWIMNFEGPTFTSIDNPAAYSDSLFSRVFTYNYIYLLNIMLLIMPIWLCFDWSMGCVPLIKDLDDCRVFYVLAFWLILLGVLIVTGYEFVHNKSRDFFILGLSMAIVPFLPASNLLIKVGFVVAERTLLMPSLGYCFLVALGYSKLSKFACTRNLFILLLGSYTLRTIHRNNDWLTEKKLFLSALDVCPLNAKVHYNIGKVAADERNLILAKEEYRRAIELNPNYEQAMNNLANILREEKRFDEAEVLLKRAIEIRPNFAAAWMNLGIVLTNLNKTEEAEFCYLTAISHRNKYPDCYYNLGNLYLDMKEDEKALAAWQKAVQFKPTHTAAWSNTLVLLDSLKEYEKALRLGEEALKTNPNGAALYFSLANTLGKMQEFEKAKLYFEKAIMLNPNNGLYYSNLGVLYHRWGKLNKAKDMYVKALKIDPTLKTTEINLSKLK